MTTGRTIDSIKKNEILFSFLGIAFFVFIFNYEAIFGLDVLLLDDNARFAKAIRGDTSSAYWLKFGWITASIKALNLKLMLIGMDFARLFYVIVFVIPLSLTIFYFNRKLLNFDYVPAFFSAILINILPFLLHIPKFIDGSGKVIGTLFLFLSLIFALKYLKSKKLLNLVLSGFLWFAANQLLNELGVVIFPALVMLFVLYAGPFKNKLMILSTYVPIMLYKLYIIISVDRYAGKAVYHTLDAIIIRSKKAIQWGSVFHLNKDFALYAAGLLLSCIVVGFLFAVYKIKRDSQKQEYLNYLFYFLFGLLSIAPFLLFSRYFSARYFHTSFIAFWILTILSIYYILLNVIKRKLIVFMLLIGLLIFSGTHRHLNQIKENNGYNKRNAVICGAIHEFDEIKSDGQVVITGKNNGTGQYFPWTTGYINYCLKRGDVVGLIGTEFSFYDPFNIKHRGHTYKMEGLDINKPLYAKRIGKKTTNNPKYYLRWFDSNDRNSKWIVYMRNSQTAMLEEYYAGSGFENYLNESEERSIATSDIFWGNHLSKKTKKGF